MTDSVRSDVAAPARDFDGLYVALLEAHPRDALHVLCGARLDGSAVVRRRADRAATATRNMRRRGMSDVLEQTEWGREIARRNLEQGRLDGMRALLRARYGDLADLDDLARQLADRDYDGNIARIVAGATLAELRS